MAEPSITEHPPGVVVQIGAWPDSVEQAAAILHRLTGAAPPAPGRTAGPLLGLAPGRWLLVDDDRGWPHRIVAAFAGGQACVTDLSAARVALRLTGPGILTLMRSHVAFDLHERAFPVGSCAQTQIHHMAVTLRRRGSESFDLLVGRSFTRSLLAWLAH